MSNLWAMKIHPKGNAELRIGSQQGEIRGELKNIIGVDENRDAWFLSSVLIERISPLGTVAISNCKIERMTDLNGHGRREPGFEWEKVWALAVEFGQCCSICGNEMSVYVAEERFCSKCEKRGQIWAARQALLAEQNPPYVVMLAPTPEDKQRIIDMVANLKERRYAAVPSSVVLTVEAHEGITKTATEPEGPTRARAEGPAFILDIGGPHVGICVDFSISRISPDQEQSAETACWLADRVNVAIAVARAEEREACAKVVDDSRAICKDDRDGVVEAIRNRCAP